MKILLDPGHGKGKEHNRGSLIGNEGDNNYKMARKLGHELEKYGFIVSYTRNKEEDNPSLSARGKMADGFDLMISVHSNAGGGTGVEVWDDVNPKYSNKVLADLLCNITAKTLNIANRGTKYRKNSNGGNYYGVLRNNYAKNGMIWEICFHDNKEDIKKYIDNMDLLAKEIARGLANYYGLDKKDVKDNVAVKGPAGEEVSPWAKEAWNWGIQNKITDGSNPGKAVTREEILTMLKRYDDMDKGNIPTTELIERGGLKIIKTSPEKIYVQKVNKALHRIGAVGINGTLYDSNGSVMILINNGKLIGKNAMYNGWNRPARPVIYYDGSKIRYEIVKNANDLSIPIKNIIWAVGGGSLPYNENENWGSDVTRSAERTGLAFKEDIVYLIGTEEKLKLQEFNLKIRNAIDIDKAIFLDGGGSTQMYFYKSEIFSTRNVDNGIFVKEV